MAEKKITVSANMTSPNLAEIALGGLVAAGFGETRLFRRDAKQGSVDIAVHCETTEEMETARQVLKDSGGQNIDATTENEHLLSF